MSLVDTYQQRKPRENVYQQQKDSSKPSSRSSVKQEAQRADDAREMVDAALRAFDLSSDFGPCAGYTRLQRWNRAERLGLNPPQAVKQLLELHPDMNENLWSGRL